MDTIFGMLIHDIPGNAINHGILSSKINKGQQTNREVLPSYCLFHPKLLYEDTDCRMSFLDGHCSAHRGRLILLPYFYVRDGWYKRTTIGPPTTKQPAPTNLKCWNISVTYIRWTEHVWVKFKFFKLCLCCASRNYMNMTITDIISKVTFFGLLG